VNYGNISGGKMFCLNVYNQYTQVSKELEIVKTTEIQRGFFDTDFKHLSDEFAVEFSQVIIMI
jgi:hypothetical protein